MKAKEAVSILFATSQVLVSDRASLSCKQARAVLVLLGMPHPPVLCETDVIALGCLEG